MGRRGSTSISRQNETSLDANPSMHIVHILKRVFDPKPLLKTFLCSFTYSDLLILQITCGIVPAFVLTKSGADWEWMLAWRPLSPVLLTMAMNLLVIGLVVPLSIPWILYLWALTGDPTDIRRRSRVHLAVHYGRAAMIAVVYVTLCKVIAGRTHPPEMGESIGRPCTCNAPTGWDHCIYSTDMECSGERNISVTEKLYPYMWDERMFAARNNTDISGDWNFFGSLRDPKKYGMTVIAGWPSGHIQAATVMASVILGENNPKLWGRGEDGNTNGMTRKIFKGLVRGYVVLMACIMCISVAWLSDVICGLAMGLAVGRAVVREHREKREEMYKRGLELRDVKIANANGINSDINSGTGTLSMT